MAGTIRTHPSGSRSRRACLNGVRPRWPEQWGKIEDIYVGLIVSMESGLDGRNNPVRHGDSSGAVLAQVSMESGLDGRNNFVHQVLEPLHQGVSMESGLDGRNNLVDLYYRYRRPESRLNGVRPRWPEQCGAGQHGRDPLMMVSMESGLDGRNNWW